MLGFDIVDQREIYLLRLSDNIEDKPDKIIVIPGRKELGELMKVLPSRFMVEEVVLLNNVVDYYDFIADCKIHSPQMVLKEKKNLFKLNDKGEVVKGD